MQLSNDRYPGHDFRVDFKINQFTQQLKIKQMILMELLEKERCKLICWTLEVIYNYIMCLDVSHHSEKLKYKSVYITIEVQFDSTFNDDATAYALILSIVV